MVTERSASDRWWTPYEVFKPLDREFGFTLDAAAEPENALCPQFLAPPDCLVPLDTKPYVPGEFYPSGRFPGQTVACKGKDGLQTRWTGERVWLNPPYGRGCGDWVLKAYREVFLYPEPAESAVLLLPAYTGPAWFHSTIWDKDIHAPRRGVQVRFLQGRIKFEGPYSDGNPARFDSMVVVMKP